MYQCVGAVVIATKRVLEKSDASLKATFVPPSYIANGMGRNFSCLHPASQIECAETAATYVPGIRYLKQKCEKSSAM